MFTQQKLIVSLALLSFSVQLRAASVYVNSLDLAGNDQHFGTVDLGTGAFHQISSSPGEEYRGLVPASSRSLLTLGFDGDLTSISPATGLSTVIGPTGLSDCSTPTSPCGPRSAGVLASFGGTLFATDFSQNLYRLNPATGAATLVGATGIPAVPFPSHFTSNPDGSGNAMTATLFAANGNLYATFETDIVDFASGNITPGIPNTLYRIDPNTAVATAVAPTMQGISAVTQVNGVSYAFDVGTQQLLSLNLANGVTSLLADVNSGFFMYVEGATPTPEPFSIALAGLGIFALGLFRLRK